MEECDVDLKAGNDIQSQMQAFMEMQSGKKKKSKVNTRHILFLLFLVLLSGLEEIVQKRLQSQSVGFHRDHADSTLSENLFSEVSTEDFLEFGFEAEFVGRLPIRVSCQNLKQDDLFRILEESEGSILHQYKANFAAYGIEVTFETSALQEIAKRAQKEKTGARALITVLERTLRNYKFELPDSGIKSIAITSAIVQNPDQELKIILANSRKEEEEIPQLTTVCRIF